MVGERTLWLQLPEAAEPEAGLEAGPGWVGLGTDHRELDPSRA